MQISDEKILKTGLIFYHVKNRLNVYENPNTFTHADGRLSFTRP